MTLPDRRRKSLVRGATFGRYVPSGHLLYVNKGALFAVSFDPDRLEVRGEPIRLLDRVVYSVRSGTAQFDCSRSGTLVYRTGAPEGGQLTVRRLDAAGKSLPLVQTPGQYGAPVLSPDGRRLALLVSEGPNREVWIYDLQRGANTKLTFDGGVKSTPTWTPDGRFVLFHGDGGIFWTRSDGSGKPEILLASKQFLNPWSFTPDGKRLAFFDRNVSEHLEPDLWTVSIENDGASLRAGKPELFLRTPFNEMAPAFSPDGRWIAYQSNESGITEVYVRAFPDQHGKRQISNSGGRFPRWSRAGNELFFHTDDGDIMAAAYTASADSFVTESPRRWTPKRLLTNLVFGPYYDVAPDGKSLVTLAPAEGQEDQPSRNHVVFLTNFFDELRRRTQPR
jgi:dipeptidyl aminopeptidase/acylaminoacyl peptidase